MAEKTSTFPDAEKPVAGQEGALHSPESLSKELETDSTPRQSQELTMEKEVQITPSKEEEQREYLTGFRLVSVLIAVTLVCFLVLLDTSIVVTVCSHLPLCE